MNTCSFNEYVEIFQKKVFENCKHKTCLRCGGLIAYFFGMICHAHIKRFHVNCTHDNSIVKKIYNPEEITQQWSEIVFKNMGKISNMRLCDYDFDIMKHMYQDLPISKIDDFLITLVFMMNAIQKTNDPNIMKINIEWLSTFVSVYKFNPNITWWDINLNFEGMWYDNRELGIKCFKQRMRDINNSRIPELWTLWEMETHEYDKNIQWLPEELIIDLLELRGESGNRFSYCTYPQDEKGSIC